MARGQDTQPETILWQSKTVTYIENRDEKKNEIQLRIRKTKIEQEWETLGDRRDKNVERKIESIYCRKNVMAQTRKNGNPHSAI